MFRLPPSTNLRSKGRAMGMAKLVVASLLVEGPSKTEVARTILRGPSSRSGSGSSASRIAQVSVVRGHRAVEDLHDLLAEAVHRFGARRQRPSAAPRRSRPLGTLGLQSCSVTGAARRTGGRVQGAGESTGARENSGAGDIPDPNARSRHVCRPDRNEA